MPTSDIYTGTGTTTVASTSATPLCYLLTGSTKRAFLLGIRVDINTVTSGTSVLFQVFRTTNTPAGGTTGSVPKDPHAPSGLATFGFGTFGTAPLGTATCLYQQTLAQSNGSAWEVWPPLGYEDVVDVSSAIALWVTAANSASTVYDYQLIWSE